jgi:hypothetical protein
MEISARLRQLYDDNISISQAAAILKIARSKIKTAFLLLAIEAEEMKFAQEKRIKKLVNQEVGHTSESSNWPILLQELAAHIQQFGVDSISAKQRERIFSGLPRSLQVKH